MRSPVTCDHFEHDGDSQDVCHAVECPRKTDTIDVPEPIDVDGATEPQGASGDPTAVLSELPEQEW